MNEMKTHNYFVNSLIETLDDAALVVQQELDYIGKVDMTPILELEKRSYHQGKLHAIRAIKNALVGKDKEDVENGNCI